MPDRPTLHVTNWSSKKLHGPGRKLSIMAAPRAWEHGDGRVPMLIPALADLRAVKHGLMDGAEYRRRFEEVVVAYFRRGHLSPGELASSAGPVLDGDTLLCACARAVAAQGGCHRVWAADFLDRAGWRVVLDGEELTLPPVENPR